ncbi:hypothetical protein PYCCODRAFT_1408364 [Trametes coccinea BRFM310]|uniref:Uncharacterized protein n=1 Tax=Trametes coccinea (strain BRFM310) TaxID=1353009 RepID=A0A1Y2IS63_TRAC3|nr:hypothetical protein PYCCODRAFT_1408364 [Trametes coccinea BRFM310]
MPLAKIPYPAAGDGILSDTPYSWTESKVHVPYESAVAEDDGEALSRKGKYRTSSRRSSIARWENWLSGFAPSALRPWLLNLPMLPTFALAYCLISALVLSGYIYTGFWKSLGFNAASSDSSLLDHIALDHLLTKVSALYPQPLQLVPNALLTPPASLTFSACLWINEADVEYIEGWAAEWRGPLSLLIATNATPASPEHNGLTDKLAALQRKHPPLKQNLFVHLLHLDSRTEPRPNSFLNLARLLAPSPRVVLFPGNLSVVPPKTLYQTLLHQLPSSSSAMTIQGHSRKRRPAVLTSKERTSFPFMPLAPLVLARDDSTWCTERFFAGMPRVMDWEECLWQVWLANFGDIEVRQVQGISSSNDAPGAVGSAAVVRLYSL